MYIPWRFTGVIGHWLKNTAYNGGVYSSIYISLLLVVCTIQTYITLPAQEPFRHANLYFIIPSVLSLAGSLHILYTKQGKEWWKEYASDIHINSKARFTYNDKYLIQRFTNPSHNASLPLPYWGPTLVFTGLNWFQCLFIFYFIQGMQQLCA